MTEIGFMKRALKGMLLWSSELRHNPLIKSVCRLLIFLMLPLVPYMSCLMTKTTNWLCAQRRLRSAWAFDQSDQSLCCTHEGSFGPYLPTERLAKTDQTGQICLRWVHISFCWFCHEVAHIMCANSKRCGKTAEPSCLHLCWVPF